MAHPVICISREFGSGGRSVAKACAQQLGLPCYDEEMLNRLLQARSAYSETYVQEAAEYARHSNWFANIFVERGVDGLSQQDWLWVIQQQLIRELAAQGPSIFVGHGADQILREDYDVLSVFVYADVDSRAKRIVERYGEREDTPSKRLKDKDRRRAAFYQFYTGKTWGDPQTYDICLNSAHLSMEEMIDIIALLYSRKASK